MAKVKTVKEEIFDMMFDMMPVMDMLVMYNKVHEKAKLPRFSFNVYNNITDDISEDDYSSSDPLICVEDGKTVSRTNIEFVSQYFTKAMKHIIREFDLYEDDIDYVTFEEYMRRVVSKSDKLKSLNIDDVIGVTLDPEYNILMDGNITREMLLENLLDNIKHIEDGDYTEQ